MEIDGTLALVTGASSGIGAATARALADRGARVLLVARTRSKLEAVAETIGDAAIVHPIDLSDPEAVEREAAAIEEVHGVPDLLVNNAGAGRWLSVEETPMEEAVQMMGAPYFAAFFVTRAFLPKMIERGSGGILMVNSPACLIAIPGAAGYSASRAALRTFTECLSAETAGTGVVVSHLIAGKVDSPYFDNNPGSRERIPAIDKMIPTLSVDDVATAICHAFERERSWVTIPFIMRTLEWLNHLAPGLVAWSVRATGWKRPTG